MNAPIRLEPFDSALALAPAGQERIREIPYNYTSFSDREIVIRLLGASAWMGRALGQGMSAVLTASGGKS